MEKKIIIIGDPSAESALRQALEQICTTTDGSIQIAGLSEATLAKHYSVDALDSDVANIIVTLFDDSGSMDMYNSEMRANLKKFQDAIVNSKESEEILVARGSFGGSGVRIGGYLQPEQFDTNYSAMGGTPLYDAVVQAGAEMIQYMDLLISKGNRVKAVFAVFSDGLENQSRATLAAARNMITELNKREVVTAFISFGKQAEAEANQLGFVNKLTLNSSESDLRHAFNCLSKSVVSNSKSAVGNTSNFWNV